MNGNDGGIEPRTRFVLRWVFNPFHYVAGERALLAGVAILGVTAALCMVSGSHLDGVLDFHTGVVGPWWVNCVEGPANWLILSVLLWAVGRLLSTSHVRAVDVFGTQALARFPYALLAMVFAVPPIPNASNRVVEAMLKSSMAAAQGIRVSPIAGVGTVDFIVFVGAMALVFAMLVWMIVLMYRAFAVSCNLSGVMAVVTFIVLLAVAEGLSKVFLIGLYRMAGM